MRLLKSSRVHFFAHMPKHPPSALPRSIFCSNEKSATDSSEIGIGRYAVSDKSNNEACLPSLGSDSHKQTSPGIKNKESSLGFMDMKILSQCQPFWPYRNIISTMAGNEAYPLRRQICESRIRWYSSMAGSADKKGSEGPVAVDYSSLLAERDFHNIADRTLEHLQERIEAYGEDLEVDGFDTDHAEGVLTVRLGSMGTYVINKQTPNRQIWLSSPVSGPARFDWHEDKKAWVYRRTKAELMSLLEKELGELLKADIDLSE